MGDVVDFPVRLEDDLEFVSDLARYAEGLFSEQEVRKRHYLDAAVWEKLGANEKLIEAIENEKIRRVRNGSAKRERAQQLVVQAPDVLGGIMLDASASPKHRIDASKALDAFAANGPESAPASDRFQIIINLGDDVLKFDKSIEINPNDIDPHNTDPNNIDTTPQKLLAVIAANKRKDDDGGGSI